ncbi:MAG: hypothetical protein GTO14_15540 [Anaerolineales bacterium]|nr:hypothetical protein [Anaerolineales bacterium]
MNEQDSGGEHQDRTCRSCLRALALFLVFPNLILLSLAFILSNLRMTLLNPAYLKQVPLKSDLYQQFPSLVVDGFLDQARSEDDHEDWVAEFEQAFGRDKVETFLRALVPPDWIQSVVEGNTDALFAWLQGRTPDLTPRINMRELRENVQQSAMREAIIGLFSDLPECGRAESFYSGDYPSCRPPKDEFELFIDEAILTLGDSFPPYDYLSTPVESGSFENIGAEAGLFVQGVYRFLMAATWVSWLMFVILTGVILLLAVRSFGEAVVWVGWQFLIVGAISVLVLGSTYILLSISIGNWITSSLTYEAIIVGPIVREFVSIYVKDVLLRWFTTAGVFIVLGAYGVFGSRLIRRIRVGWNDV